MEQPPVKLSVVIITFNEENNIGRCIDSLGDIADEVLVVDSFSTDRTASICKEKGARFIQHAFDGYIQQKNFALGEAAFDHILSLDADEALSEELKENISQLKHNWTDPGYSFNRKTSFCGKWVNHGGWYPDTKVRLFVKGSGRWDGVNPHDEYRFNNNLPLKRLNGDLLHYSYTSITGHIRQIDHFSSIAAAALHESGKKTNIFKLIISPVFRFIRHYFLQLGLLDGLTGFVIAANSAFGVYLKYLRLYHLQKGKKI